MRRIRTRWVAAVCFVALTATNVKAKDREEHQVSIGAEMAFPGGDFGSRNAGTGFGASVRYEYAANEYMSLTGNVGYLSFGKKSMETGFGVNTDYTSSIIPILIGVKYYLNGEDNGLHFGAQLGLSMLSMKYSTPAFDYQGTTIDAVSNTYKKSAFTYNIGIGYRVSHLDFEIGYYVFDYSISTPDFSGGSASTLMTDYTGGWTGIRVAYFLGGD